MKSHVSAATIFTLILFAAQLGLAATLTLETASTPAAEKAVQSYTIRTPDAAGFGALQMDFIFDPKQIEIASVQKGGLLANADLQFNVAAAGMLKVAVASMDAVTGQGDIMAVRYRRLTQDQGRPLRIANPKAWDNSTYQEIPVNIREIGTQTQAASPKGSARGDVLLAFKTVPLVLVGIGVFLTMLQILNVVRAIGDYLSRDHDDM